MGGKPNQGEAHVRILRSLAQWWAWLNWLRFCLRIWRTRVRLFAPQNSRITDREHVKFWPCISFIVIYLYAKFGWNLKLTSGDLPLLVKLNSKSVLFRTEIRIFSKNIPRYCRSISRIGSKRKILQHFEEKNAFFEQLLWKIAQNFDIQQTDFCHLTKFLT